MLPIVSIIIPTKNEKKNIIRCLESIRRQTYHRTEVIVVDNYSIDQTVRLARQAKAKTYLKGPERSYQRNWGAKHAMGDILGFIDADMELGQNVIKQAVNIFQKSTITVALIIPEVSAGTNYWARVRALERKCYVNESAIEAPRIFRKKAFFQSGQYDPRLTAAEDWDLKNRIIRYGRVGRTKDYIIHHEGNLSLYRHLAKKYYYARHIKPYAQKNPIPYQKQAFFYRTGIFFRHWRQLITDPFHAAGMILMKVSEYIIFLSAKLL